MTTRALTLALAVLLLVAPSAAEASRGTKAKRPDLSTTNLRAPSHAHPGGAAQLDVVVLARWKRAARTTTRFWLSADRRKGKRDVRLASTATPRLKARGRFVARANATLPRTTRVGTWFVLACADDTRRVRERDERDNCTARKLTVAAEGSTPSARSLIDADRKAGRLSAEQALTYRVFAEFGDRRLPVKYRGDDGGEADESVIREVSAAYPTMSRRAKRTLYPFFLPPPAKGSWANLKSGALASAAQDDEEFEEDTCDSEQLAGKEWGTASGAGGKLRIWWLKDNKEDAARAPQLLRELATIAYPRMKAAMGRDLKSDASSPCFHGPDGALDIYLIPRIAKGRAMSIPSAQSPKNNLICDGTASFIVAESGYRPPKRWDLAHELFHSFQYLFPYQGDCRDYLWFDEGSANWGANMAFPNDNDEHFYNYFLWYPERSLPTEDYGSWVFDLFLERTVGRDAIRGIYEEFGRQAAVPAIDKAIGGFRKRWKEFTKYAWNRDPIAGSSFQAWDAIPDRPLAGYQKEMEPQHLFLAGQKQRTAYARAGMDRLARQYHWFTVTDDKLRELKFVNPQPGDEDFGVQAIVTVNGQQRVEDWTGRRTVTFCRDKGDQNVTELVLMYSNAKREEGQRIDAEPELRLRDECEGFPYRYKVLSASFREFTQGASAATHPCSALSGIRGSSEFKGTLGTPLLDAENRLERSRFGDVSGRIYAKVPAQWNNVLHGCIQTDDLQIQPCSTTKTETPRPTGDWKIGFSVRADSADAKTATATWAVSNPSVGYFDADNSVCNFTELWKGLEYETSQEQISMEKLADTAPQTYTFTGGPRHFDTTTSVRDATLDYDWSYTVTVQRVDEQGLPLE